MICTNDFGILPRQKGKVIAALTEEELVYSTNSELVKMDTDTVYEHLTSIYGVYSNTDRDIENFLCVCSKYGIRLEQDNHFKKEIVCY